MSEASPWTDDQAVMAATAASVSGRSIGGVPDGAHYTHWIDEFPTLQEKVADAAEAAGARLVVAIARASDYYGPRASGSARLPADRCDRRPCRTGLEWFRGQ